MSVSRTFRRLAVLGAGVLVAALTAAGLAAGPALAVSTPPQTITGNVVIPESISLAITTTSFTLTGEPGTTQTTTLPGNSVVTTNDTAGYLLYTYPPLSNVFTGGSATFPTSDLSVYVDPALDGTMIPGAGTYATLGNNTGTASAPDGGTLTGASSNVSATGGDAWDNDYQMTIPTEPSGTYTAALLEVAWGR
jgi:hypothetical protein